MKNYYKILNVPKDASPELIKQKYRKKALKYHPDKNLNNKEALRKFKLVSEAYNTLIDPYKRGRYDVELEKGYHNDIFDFSFNNSLDLFNDLFKSSMNLNDELEKLSNNKNIKTYSYSSSTINNNGEVVTKKKIQSNINGKKNKYYTEYITDKKGNQKIIKQSGDPSIFQNKYKINNLQLRDRFWKD